jgi:hypothetical protein
LFAYITKKRSNEVPVKLSEQMEQGFPVHGKPNVPDLTTKKSPMYKECSENLNLRNVAEASQPPPPIKQSKNSVLTCEIWYAMFQQVIAMLMCILGLSCGLSCGHVTQEALAAGQQLVAN